MLTVKYAQDIIAAQAQSFGEEMASIEECQNRVLAQDLVADRDYPPFNRATMDGYAIKSTDVRTPTSLVLSEEIFAGSSSDNVLQEGHCVKIMTGAPVPAGADAVVKVEDTESEQDRIQFKIGDIPSGQYIAYQGEDASLDDALVPKGTICDPTTVSAMAVTGTSAVKVFKTPSVSIISTGTEVKSLDQDILPHQIRDSNSYALRAFLHNYRISLDNKILVEDDPQRLAEVIESCLTSEILILSGGVSMGDADFVPGTLTALGVQKLFHKVQIKPGKPLWFGTIPKGGVVFGLPGNPMSTQVAFKVFIEPYLRKCFSMPRLPSMLLPTASARKKDSPFDSYFPATIDGKQPIRLNPIAFNSSGDITSTLNCDGLAVHPGQSQDIQAGDVVEFHPW